MSAADVSAALRKCRGCGEVYPEDGAHPCSSGSDPYTVGMTIEEARRVYGIGKGAGVTYTSARNLPLVAQTPGDVPVLTVENYGKWYTLHLLHPDGRVEAVSYGALDGFCDAAEETPYVDHVPNPVLVERLCNAMGWELDEQSHEMMIGRWILEGLDLTLGDVHRRVRG